MTKPGMPIPDSNTHEEGASLVNLSANESPLSPSPRVIDAIRDWLGNLNRYPDKDGVELRQVIAKVRQIQPANVVIGNGSSEILDLAARTYLQAGDEAILGAPAFFPYQSVVGKAHGVTVVVSLKDYCYDLDRMIQAITGRTRLIILGNPNNPTGTTIGRNELAQFLTQVPEDVITIVDEAYVEYVRQEDFPDTLEYVRQDRPVIVLRTLSKAYGLAGLRIGYGMAPAAIIQRLDKTRQHYNTNQLAQIAAIVALEDNAYLKQSVESNTLGLEFLCGELDRLQIEYVPSEANFLLVRVGEGGVVCRDLLGRGIQVQAMDRYQLPAFIRVTVGLPEENKKFIDAIAGIVK